MLVIYFILYFTFEILSRLAANSCICEIACSKYDVFKCNVKQVSSNAGIILR